MQAQNDTLEAQKQKANTGSTVAGYENTGIRDPRFASLSTALPTAQAMSEYDAAMKGGNPITLQPGSTAVWPSGQSVGTSLMGGAPTAKQAFISPSRMKMAEMEQSTATPMRQGATIQQEEPISPPPTAMPMPTPTGIGTPSQDKALQLINFLKSISTTSSKPLPNIRTGF